MSCFVNVGGRQVKALGSGRRYLQDKEAEKEFTALDRNSDINTESAALRMMSAGEEVRSVVLTGYGGYECLKVKPWPIQALGAGDVRVAVAICGVNFSDLYTRQGMLRELQPPLVLGTECVGEVTAVGAAVAHIKVGDHVLCYKFTGGLYRDHVVVAASHCFVLPPGMSYEDSAALPANYLTAYFCVHDIGHMRAGQSIFISSCAGGVGWAATQLACSAGDVTIFGTCSPEKHDAVRENGVTHPLTYDGYEQELLKHSPDGVDIIIDNMASSAFTINQRLLKPLGRIVVIGANSMVTDSQKFGWWSFLRLWWSTKNVSARDLIMQNRVVAGLHLGLLMERQPNTIQSAMSHLFQLYEQGKIKPHIDSIWPFDKVVEAMRVLAERKNVGKVLLRVETTDK